MVYKDKKRKKEKQALLYCKTKTTFHFNNGTALVYYTNNCFILSFLFLSSRPRHSQDLRAWWWSYSAVNKVMV